MLAWSGPLWAADTFAGRSLVEVLEQFRAEGMLVVYSSDVVDESLRVVAEPSAPTRELMLAEMLVALGLGLERRGDILLVVKPPSSADPPSQQGDVKNQLPSPQIENVVVHASRFAVGERAPASFALLRDNDIDQLVGAGREPLKTLARLPGMASSGLSSKQNVRGGEQDEMLLVFDGLPLFEPFHLKDFQSLFSTLDPRVVGAIEVYTGGFPAQYGDRLSGVIDVTPQPPADRPHHEIGVDFFNAGILSKGPFAQGQGEWLLSARRGTLDLLFDVVNTDIGDPSYYDVLAQLKRQINDNLSLSGSVMLADDRISLNETDFEIEARTDHRTSHVWFGLEHNLDDELSYRTVVARVDSDNHRTGRLDRPEESVGDVHDRRRYRATYLKQDWRFAPSPRFLARWGADLRLVSARYDYRSQLQFFDDDLLAQLTGASDRDFDLSARPDGSQLGLYLSNRWRFTPRWTAELGLRWDRQTYTGQNSEQISPRMSFLFQPAPRTRLRFGWGRFSQAQGVHELQIEDGITDFFPAQRSYHMVAGLDHEFGNELSLRFEVYRKHMDRLQPRFENLFDQLELLPELSPDRVRVDPDRALARGAEILLRQSRDDRALNWWLAASVASVEDNISGKDVPRSWDQPLAVNAGLNWQRGLWRADVVAHYHDGWPTTAVSIVDTMPMLGERNQQRLSGFFSLDMRVARRKPLGERRAWTVFLEVINLTSRKNVCCVDYSVEDDNSVVIEQDYWLRAVPSIGVLFEF